MEEKLTQPLDNKLIVSSSPHIRSNKTTQRIMLDVIIALVPAAIASVYFFGMRSLIIMAVSVVTAVLAEFVTQKLLKREVTIGDLSAVVTGLLLAFNVPVSLPLYMVAFGSLFAIVIVKQVFGGIGSNFMNPALAGRAVLVASWPEAMTAFTRPMTDLVSMATPLSGGPAIRTMDMFLGKMPGSLGEVSALAILIGFAYLLFRDVISWRIPVVYVAVATVLGAAFGTPVNELLTYVLSGGLLLGAVFMATDYSSSPTTVKGQFIFAIGAGILTAVIRAYGGYPEGVSYSILLMNSATPLIDKLTIKRQFGGAEQ